MDRLQSHILLDQNRRKQSSEIMLFRIWSCDDQDAIIGVDLKIITKIATVNSNVELRPVASAALNMFPLIESHTPRSSPALLVVTVGDPDAVLIGKKALCRPREKLFGKTTFFRPSHSSRSSYGVRHFCDREIKPIRSPNLLDTGDLVYR